MGSRIVTALSAGLAAVLITASAAALEGSGQITVPYSADKVWAAIGDFGSLHAWHPAVEQTDVEGDGGNGIYRTLTLGDGGTIREILVGYSMPEKFYEYAIIEGVLPVANYVSTIQVKTGASDEEAVVEWSSTFDANGVADDEAVKLINGIYEAGLGNLEQAIGGH